ncbi:MAG: MerR family transcriptional regulator [Propionivibrio sp.]
MSPPLTISALARRFDLSRSALLHYDRIGLLTPGGRTAAGYRRYSEADAERLHAIQTFRQAGVPLAGIRTLLDGPGSATRAVLLGHLEELARRIAELQAQQQRVVALLGIEGLSETPHLLTREAMVAIFRSAGLDDEGMDRLHVHFEKTDPAAHQRFLESLGLDAAHIARVRQQSRDSAL